MARILVVGNATLDFVHTVECYPREDEEVRALSRSRRRGGNAANTAVVLRRLGHACGWAGVCAQAPESDWILQDLGQQEVDTRHVAYRPGHTPMSFVTLSRATGSRTIVHYRELGEYTFADFREIDPAGYDWLHFEARNVPEIRNMIGWVREQAPGARVSVEIEKERAEIETLYPLADVLLFSAGFARGRGFEAREWLQSVRQFASRADLYCSRGASGAVALDCAGIYHESPAYRPREVVDTLGAGDVFNAAIIDGYFSLTSTAGRLAHACRLAGEKCGYAGFGGERRDNG